MAIMLQFSLLLCPRFNVAYSLIHTRGLGHRVATRRSYSLGYNKFPTNTKSSSLSTNYLQLRQQTSRQYHHLNHQLSTRSKLTHRLQLQIQQQQDYSDYYANHVDSEIERLRGYKVSDYWINELKKLDRPSAKALISQLNAADNPLGYDPPSGPVKKGTFLDFTIQQKKLHEDKIILIRNGEFYETFGLDSLMLINYCGLNPMGGKAKAGCPAKNIQATLDGLTSVGLSVAVYEEASEIDATVINPRRSQRSQSSPTTKAKIKHRILTQIVSPASTTYAYDLCLRVESIDYKENKPIIALMHSAMGYTVHEIWLDEKRVAVSDRLTLEAVRTLIEEKGFVEPVYVFDADSTQRSRQKRSPIGTNTLSFLPSIESINAPNEKNYLQTVFNRINKRFEVETERFRWQQPHQSEDLQRPRPIYISTALQIGLFENPNVPDLIAQLLPVTHYAHSAKFLRKWLLHPPNKRLAQEMRTLCETLSDLSVALPPFAPIPVGKLVSLLDAKQANIGMLSDIRQSIASMQFMLSKANYEFKENEMDSYRKLVNSLFELTSSEVGSIKFDQNQILQSCHNIIAMIDAVIQSDSVATNVSSVPNSPFVKVSSDPSNCIPNEFFQRNEGEFKNKIVSSIPIVSQLYSDVNAAAQELIEAVRSDVPANAEVVFDIFDNALMFRDVKLSTSTNKRNAKQQQQKLQSGLTQTAAVSEIEAEGEQDNEEQSEFDSESESETTTAQMSRKQNRNNNNNNSEHTKQLMETSEGIQEVSTKEAAVKKYIAYVDRKGSVVSKRYTTERVARALQQYRSLVERAPAVIASILQVC